MNNTNFIKKYGKREYNSLYFFIQEELSLARMNRQIGGYKINRKKGIVKFYLKNQDSVCLEFALIYGLKRNGLEKYLIKIQEERGAKRVERD